MCHQTAKYTHLDISISLSWFSPAPLASFWPDILQHAQNVAFAWTACDKCSECPFKFISSPRRRQRQIKAKDLSPAFPIGTLFLPFPYSEHRSLHPNVMNENHRTVEAWRTKPDAVYWPPSSRRAHHRQQEIQLEEWKSSPTCASSPAAPVSPAMHQHKDRMKPQSVILENANWLGKSKQYPYTKKYSHRHQGCVCKLTIESDLKYL